MNNGCLVIFKENAEIAGNSNEFCVLWPLEFLYSGY